MTAPIASERPHPAIDIIEFFKTRSALVVAAVAALDALPSELATLKALLGRAGGSGVSRRLQGIEAVVAGAEISGDNLLVAKAASVRDPFVMCSVSRQPSGAVDVRTIELDRDALALAGATCGPSPRPLDSLLAAIGALASGNAPETAEAAATAIDAVSVEVRASVSRLSIVKARLDLQQSFLASVMDADCGSPFVRLDSHLNQAGARDMALEARRLLSSGTLTIASGNRKTLTSLFERHTAGERHAATKPVRESLDAEAD